MSALLNRQFNIRILFIFAGGFILYEGFHNWLRGRILEHPGIILIHTVVYLMAFSLFFLALIDDNRLENLRLLCPNCNSQQSTFAGRKLKVQHVCSRCFGPKKSKNSRLCNPCSNLERRKREHRPTITTLMNDVEKLGFVGTGRKYGVSDNAIRKWLRQA